MYMYMYMLRLFTETIFVRILVFSMSQIHHIVVIAFFYLFFYRFNISSMLEEKSHRGFMYLRYGNIYYF